MLKRRLLILNLCLSVLLCCLTAARGAEDDQSMEESQAAQETTPKGKPGQKPAADAGQVPEVNAAKNFDLVKIPSGALNIYGILWKPQGSGPFPAIVYNHGSEQKVANIGYGVVGNFYAKNGFVCL